MHNSDKELFFSSLQSVMDVFGKQKLTAGAAQIWWDSVKEFDHNDVFTALNFWPQYNSKPPIPADIWRHLNEKRTAKLEEKAKSERLVNTGRALPDDYAPTPEGKALFKIMRKFLGQKGKTIQQMILDEHDNYGNMPSSVVEWAREQ